MVQFPHNKYRMDFIYAFTQRVLSGVQSYFGYSKKFVGFIVMTLVLCQYPVIHLLYPVDEYEAFRWLLFAFLTVNMMVVMLKFFSFNLFSQPQKKWMDIHLWENFVTGGYMVFLVIAGANILLLICSVYPALILHKGFINLGSKLKFFDEATDDPTGKTYGIPALGIKIPRLNTKWRLLLAGISLVLAVVFLYFDLNISFSFFAY